VQSSSWNTRKLDELMLIKVETSDILQKYIFFIINFSHAIGRSYMFTTSIPVHQQWILIAAVEM